MAAQKFYFSKTKENVHHEMFPHSFRMLIVGPSGCGKTSLLMKMLLQENLLNYDKLYVFVRSLYQPEYQLLRHGLENGLHKRDVVELLDVESTMNKNSRTIEQLCRGMADYNDDNDIPPSNITCKFSEDGNDIPDPASIDGSNRNLIMFDDIMTNSKQTHAENYYNRGRSANCDCIYLSQNYTRLPLHTIRSITNFTVFFKSPLVVDQLHRNFVSADIDNIDEFRKMCKDTWSKKYGYLAIDLSRDFGSGHKYRTSLEL
jgi:GTPase SAR1 family protein